MSTKKKRKEAGGTLVEETQQASPAEKAAPPPIIENEQEFHAIADLKPHPRNYRNHPDDQIEHLIQSLRENGVYRNVVIARDGTILAGHGVVKAATKMGLEGIPVIKLDLDPDDPRALKILTGDNELLKLAEVDDRALTELLKEIKETDIAGLLGTGYDDSMLANLLFVTRPVSEVADFDAAQAWVGMPEFEASGKTDHIIVHFRTPEDRAAFAAAIGQDIAGKKYTWFPPKEQSNELSAYKVE